VLGAFDCLGKDIVGFVYSGHGSLGLKCINF
jgi:hypothetical protein